MPNIYEQRFWDELDAMMWDGVAEVLITTLLFGVESGTDSLSPAAQSQIDFDNINKGVMEYAKKYRYEWIKGITNVSRESTQKTIADWIQSGSPLSALEAALDPIYGPNRAARIAATETTRVFAEGNREVWESTGLVEEMIWMTAEDDRVCEICGPLDGVSIGIGDIDAIPPAHVNCRCWVKPVVSEQAFADQLDEIFQ